MIMRCYRSNTWEDVVAPHSLIATYTPRHQNAMLTYEIPQGIAFNLFALLFLAHVCFPRSRVYTSKFFSFAYANSSTEKYGLGKEDGFLIFSYITLFTGLRASTMEYILAPFAKSKGIVERKAITRFSEQAWLLTYYVFFWPIGYVSSLCLHAAAIIALAASAGEYGVVNGISSQYLYYNSQSYMNLRGLWADWPDREMTGLMKAYMLGQLSFWLQQVLVINIEERRKDHWQMLTHHFVTISLIFCSYCYGHTRVATLILVLMDVVDLFLPVRLPLFLHCL